MLIKKNRIVYAIRMRRTFIDIRTLETQRGSYLVESSLVKAMVFPVVMYGCESWTVKKAEHRRIDAFELCWRRLLSPFDCKEIQPIHSKGDQSWVFFGRNDAKAENSSTLATSCKELTHWKRL